VSVRFGVRRIEDALPRWVVVRPETPLGLSAPLDEIEIKGLPRDLKSGESLHSKISG